VLGGTVDQEETNVTNSIERIPLIPHLKDGQMKQNRYAHASVIEDGKHKLIECDNL
jgi:hypothetical protein